MRPEERLRRAPAPDADGARDRARRVVASATPAGAPRRVLARLATGAVLLTVVIGGLSSPGDAVARWVRELVASEQAAPPPEPVLASLPSPGRLLVSGPDGGWVVGRDGSRRRLGAYTELAWSPHGLFVAATRGRTLQALTPDGEVRWRLTQPAPIADPRWSPSGYRIAYRTGGAERVVAGDGSGDHPLVGDVAPIAPAWRPGHGHQLAVARPRGSVELWSADAGLRMWRTRPSGATPVALAWASRRRLVVVRRASIEILDGRGRRVRLLSVGPRAVSTAALGPSGQVVALAQGDIVSTLRLSGARRRKVRLTAAGPVSGIEFSPDRSRLLVASDAADQWVFLPLRSTDSVTAVTVRGFPRVGGWCCAPDGRGRFTLASAKLRDGRRVFLRSRKDLAGPCLRIVGIDESPRHCGRAPSELEPASGASITGQAVAQRSPAAAFEVYGATSAAVRRVVVGYTLGGARHRRAAVLMRADDPSSLELSGISEPFGYFLAELPSRATEIRAAGFAASGARLGTDRIPRRLSHPHAFIAQHPARP